MTGGLRIAKLFGIPIYLHATWLVVFLLLTMGLMQLPLRDHPEWGVGTRWLLAAATSLLFFGSQDQWTAQRELTEAFQTAYAALQKAAATATPDVDGDEARRQQAVRA